ncbi:zwei Ig domain protein zig-8-like [Macrobrachium nipponense]|uniref:zwei Ig domain protein zig-8-like n=1 Tax=Macrobrachium nipponense TaxID=159736 RepID=UPI0030C7C0CA
MTWDFNSLWMLCGVLHLVFVGAAIVYSPSLQVPYVRSSDDRLQFYRKHHHHPNTRTSRSNGNSIARTSWRQLEANLSGSSSSPVQPIKPLLDLNSGYFEGGNSIASLPMFDAATPRNVTFLAGQSAYLHCLVHNLANKSVSWIRQRDLHILTVGRYTYTTDQRYQVIHSQGSKDWILKIKYAQERDAGNYECQVSTKPVKTYVVYLNVYTAARAEIIGSPDMHVDVGSTINLTCIITHSSDPPTYINWFYNQEPLEYDSPRGGITLLTERGKTTTGYLLIQNAKPSDTGNYSCSPSNTKPATLRLHVLNGETPAAMQTNGTSRILPSYFADVIFLVVFIWSLSFYSSIQCIGTTNHDVKVA